MRRARTSSCACFSCSQRAAAGGLRVMRRIKLLLKDNNISKKHIGSSGKKAPALNCNSPSSHRTVSALSATFSPPWLANEDCCCPSLFFFFGSLTLKLGRSPFFPVWPPFEKKTCRTRVPFCVKRRWWGPVTTEHWGGHPVCT